MPELIATAAALPPSASFQALLLQVEQCGGTRGSKEAIALYRRFIATHRADPFLPAAWFNLAVELGCAGDEPAARVAYRTALRANPGFAPAAINLGLSLERGGDVAGAMAVWTQATQDDEARTALLNHRARVLEIAGRFEEAALLLGQSLRTAPQQPDAIQHYVHLRQKMCLWPALEGADLGLAPAIMARHCGALASLALFDSVSEQTRIAADWVARKTQPAPERLSSASGYRHDRIRVGYLSSDFCRHAMSYLIAEVFEQHDRTRFEIYGYCSSIDDGSAIRARVLNSFDHWRSVLHLSDEAAARLIRADEIDILVDLNGLTQGSRLQVLRWRPAPVQATYLGFVGPVPLPELDYLFCDKVVVPDDVAADYQPRPLSIGPLYQANDRHRELGAAIPRASLGLADDAFVFCCFSNHYKITETLFACWMRILARVPNGVLWLASGNRWSDANLRLAASRAGIDPERLVIAPRTDPASYMARLAAADLFLDTFPYNAGTVASDALRMGLPLVTCSGQSFASRMAASLLTAMAAPEGITDSLTRYEDVAVRLANDPAAYARYKASFGAARWEETLGNVPAMVAGYEAVLSSIVRLEEN